jgi:hypothetical protein
VRQFIRKIQTFNTGITFVGTKEEKWMIFPSTELMPTIFKSSTILRIFSSKLFFQMNDSDSSWDCIVSFIAAASIICLSLPPRCKSAHAQKKP